jgi:exportin-2 (importin alpha re-exporter)
LVRLLQAIMARGAPVIVENNQLTPILGIFQKLVSSKITEVHAFDLLEALFTYFPVYVSTTGSANDNRTDFL